MWLCLLLLVLICAAFVATLPRPRDFAEETRELALAPLQRDHPRAARLLRQLRLREADLSRFDGDTIWLHTHRGGAPYSASTRLHALVHELAHALSGPEHGPDFDRTEQDLLASLRRHGLLRGGPSLFYPACRR
jgi:hypothetical protein